MTANHIHTARYDFAGRFSHIAGRIGILLAKVSLGILILVAATIIALATAIMGVILAIAAIILRFSGKTQAADPAGDGHITLDARRTAKGWTTE